MSANGLRLSSDSFPGPLSEARTASTAGGGTALTTTASIIGLPTRTTHIGLTARNFTTAVVIKYSLNPFLRIITTTNLLSTFTDASEIGQRNPATASAVSLSSFPTLANGGAIYLGSPLPFRGIAVTMSGSVNAVVSTLLGEYWNGAWTSASITDGTASGGATFAQTGNITFTVPSDWVKVVLPNTLPGAKFTPQQAAQQMPNTTCGSVARYWIRLSVSAALTASTAVNTMFSMNRSTTYAEIVANSLVQFRVPAKGIDEGPACIEALTDAGTANLIVTAYTDNNVSAF